MKIYAIVAGVIAVVVAGYGLYRIGFTNGQMVIANQYSKREVQRQEKITSLSLRLVNAQATIDKQTEESAKIARNIQDSCGDTRIPDAVADQLR